MEEFERTAETITHQIKLLEDSSDKEIASPIFLFPTDDKPQTLLEHKGQLFVGNWQTGNIAILNPANKTIMKIVELDNYEAILPSNKKREIRRYPPGDMTIADEKLFVGQVFSDFIIMIDIDTKAIVKRLTIPGGGEGKLTSSKDGRHVFFASNRVEQFFIIDSATYEFEAIRYPSDGRGSMSIFAHPRKKLLYIGIQRGGKLNGRSYLGGNSFLAVYDLDRREYVNEIYLAEIIGSRCDDSSPICITYDKTKEIIFVWVCFNRGKVFIKSTL